MIAPTKRTGTEIRDLMIESICDYAASLMRGYRPEYRDRMRQTLLDLPTHHLLAAYTGMPREFRRI